MGTLPACMCSALLHTVPFETARTGGNAVGADAAPKAACLLGKCGSSASQSKALTHSDSGSAVSHSVVYSMVRTTRDNGGSHSSYLVENFSQKFVASYALLTGAQSQQQALFVTRLTDRRRTSGEESTEGGRPVMQYLLLQTHSSPKMRSTRLLILRWATALLPIHDEVSTQLSAYGTVRFITRPPTPGG